MKEFYVTYKAKGVNSNRLLKTIITLLEEVSNEYIHHQQTILDRTYDYSELVTFLEMFFVDLHDQKVITHFDVVADQRNNTVLDVRDGKINVTLRYKQMHCLNVSQIDAVLVAR